MASQDQKRVATTLEYVWRYWPPLASRATSDVALFICKATTIYTIEPLLRPFPIGRQPLFGLDFLTGDSDDPMWAYRETCRHWW
jgi:hypothetical protein